MTTFYVSFSGLLGAAVLWLAIANGRLAVGYARSRDWANLSGRILVVLLEDLIGSAGVTAAFLIATGLLRPT